MFSILLIIIYIAFISLGLSDALLGSAWPVMHELLGVPLSYAGIVSIIISGGTIVSSLLSDRATRKFGTGLVMAISVFMTAAALLGFSTSSYFPMLCLWAVPYGLGAGAVDAALNNYVALHYASRHMSWLHCFWGVGAATSPYIMGYYLAGGYGWNGGYRAIALLQIVLTAILFISLPLWEKRNVGIPDTKKQTSTLGLSQALRIKGVKLILVTFFCYCALESTAGLWASSYLVEFRGIDPETAARFASLFYLGITIGRFSSGFIADRVGDKWLIRFGMIIILSGVVLVAAPIKQHSIALGGLVAIGLGCAPIFPAMIHSTPFNFGVENSQAIIGVQMASAYAGNTLMPPLFGAIASGLGVGLYPFYLLLIAVLMFVMSETLNKVIAAKV